MFASLRSNVISFLCSNDFLLEWGNGLSGEKCVGTGAQFPQASVLESRDFKNNTEVL